MKPVPTIKVPGPPVPRLTDINRDLSLLHPTLRQAVGELIGQMLVEGIPFRVFEGFRGPSRQSYLYDQGRSRPGRIVTKARAWQSYHQYGLAVDFALYLGGNWSWDDTGVKAEWWDQLHEIGTTYGLEPLEFEKPHLQLAGLNIPDLLRGSFPGGGDASWWSNLEAAIKGWKYAPPAPVIKR